MAQIKKEKKHLFNFDGGFYGITERLFDGLALGLLWILFSLPVITIGAATSALYYTANKVIKQDRGYLFREFWKAFRMNFKQATLLWIVVAVMSFLLQLNVGILDALTDGYLGLFFIVFYALCAILIVATAVYGFAAISRFDMPFGWILKLSLFMTMRYFLTTVMILVVFAGAALVFYLYPLLLLFLPTPVVLAHRYFIERVLVRHMPKEEEPEEKVKKYSYAQR